MHEFADRKDPRDPIYRLQQLFDCDTLEYIDGVDTGFASARGLVDGKPLIAFSSDARVKGGAIGVEGCQVVVNAYEKALAKDLPIIGLWHSGGARLTEGVASLDAVGQVFSAMTHASGRIPQISIVLGPAAGGAAYGPALTDIVIMSEEGRIFVTGPQVVRTVTGESIDDVQLGGPEPHSRSSGVVHVVAKSEREALAYGRSLASLLRSKDSRTFDLTGENERRFVSPLPKNGKRAYDVHPIIDRLLDEDETKVEIHEAWAPNIVTTLGKFGGESVGLIANNPMRLGGCLDSAAAEKASRFVRMCDAFGIPLVVLVDVPGYLPGVGQEWEGVVRRGAKLLHAFSESVVPRVTLVMRKSYGGAYIAMNSRSLGATKVFAWPDAEVAVMGNVAAVRILHKRELAKVDASDRARLELELAEKQGEIVGGIDRAVEIGVVDEILDPQSTRLALLEALSEAEVRRGMHGNIPL